MFLSQVELSLENKRLFVDLATLLVTAEPRVGNVREILNKLNSGEEICDSLGEERGDNWFVPTLEEVEALKICMLELGDFVNRYEDFTYTYEDRTNHILLEAFFKRRYLDSLKDYISEAAVNSDYKKQVLMSFIEMGVELSDIDQNRNEQALAQIPDVRKALILSVLEQAFVDLDVNDLSKVARKIFLFELVALAYSDGSVHELEKLVVDFIADKFDIDEETLEELKESAEEIVMSVRNAAEVIFE